MGKYLLYLIIGTFIYLTFHSSCANVGIPSGGAKDSIPPVIVKSEPALNETNFTDTKVRIYFDEFIIHEGLTEKFTISPPLEERAIFKTKGKSIIVDLKEDLKENTTYSLDFKDAIADNNEKNPIKDLRMAFSTGSVIDSLRIVGFVKDAFTLNPIPDAYILLYNSPSDTMVYTTRPDFIAKTNEQGFYAVTNLPGGTYQAFALIDNNRDLKFEPGAEPIAFLDSMITPSAIFIPDRDTTVIGSDTLVILGNTRFYPDPVYFLQFEEEFFSLRLDDYQRPERNYVDFIFTESVKDTFNIELLNYEPENDWYLLESTTDKDSLRIWLTDSLVYNKDTLQFKLTYLQQDSLKAFYAYEDTIKLYYSDTKVIPKGKKRSKRKIKKKPVSIDLKQNSKGSGFDIYRELLIESPEPLVDIDTTMIRLSVKKDTIFEPVDFIFKNKPEKLREYIVKHKWDFETTYKLEVDSGAAHSIYDLPSNALEATFTVQSEDHYGTIIFNMQNITGPVIFQLLKDNEDETIVRSKIIYADGLVELKYIESQKYLIKLIFDDNDNGKWDTGNLIKKIKPEEVIYYDKIIKVRKNWEQKEDWILPSIIIRDKKIIDEEEEEEKKRQKELKSKSKRRRI